MKLIHSFAALAVAASALACQPAAFAEEHHDHPYVHHEEWKKGYHMKHEDWARGERIDYRHYHLNAPPRGYEWREVDGNYVLAAVATGVVASVIAASSVH
jgi:Ni/Co efflux regulator RcnB